jgi:hypothetical protein
MWRLSSIAAGLVLAGALGQVISGCGASSFECSGNASCAGLSDGRCEADGHCSIPDEECPSGRRYAPYSGQVSDQCVDGEGTGSSSGSTGSEADSSTSMASPASTSGDPTSDLPPGSCQGQLLVDEPFDALPLDPEAWEFFNQEGIAINVLDSELRMSAIDATAAYSNLATVLGLPVAGSVGLEVTAAPPSRLPGEAYLSLVELDITYGFELSGGTLQLFHNDGFEPMVLWEVDHDPIEHRWLRLMFDRSADRLAWESSPDGSAWTTLNEVELLPEFELANATIYIGAGVWDGPSTADPLAAFGHAFICEGWKG